MQRVMFSPALCNLVTVLLTLYLGIQEDGGCPWSSLASVDTAQKTEDSKQKCKVFLYKYKKDLAVLNKPPSVVKGEATWADITASLSGLEDKTGCGVSSSSLCAVRIGCLVSPPPVSDHMLHPPQSPRLPFRLASPCQVSPQALPTSRAPRS